MNRKQLILTLVIMSLFAVSLLSNVNLGASSIPVTRGNEPNMTSFSLSAEGTIHDDSILSFSETTADDVLFYPDAFNNDIAILASSGTAGPDEFEDYLKTHQFDDGGVDFYYATGTPSAWVTINFTVPSGTIEGFDYALFIKGAYLDDHADYYFYNWDTDAYVDFGDAPVTAGNGEWRNGTVYDASYYNTQVSMKLNSTDADDWAGVYIDYAQITFYTMTLADSNHYAESFADVSDWTYDSESAGLPARSFITDNDVLTFEIDYDDAGNEWAKYDFDVSGYSNFQYLEIRYITSATTGAYKSTRLTVYVDGVSILSSYSSTWNTWKGYIVGSISEPYTTVMVMVDDYANTHASDSGYAKIDYLHIGPATEMGWQHDGSTTAGTEEEARSGWSYSLSTDADLLTMTFSRSGGSSTYGSIYLNFDTSTTESDLEADYYPFLGLSWECSALTADDFYVIPCLDGKTNVDDSELVGGQKFTSTFAQTTHRISSASLTGTTSTIGLRFIVRGDDGENATLKIDWAKAYSIANFSLALSDLDTDDYIYVEDGSLKTEIDEVNGYIQIEMVPAISVSTSTYNLFNLTISDVTAVEANDYGLRDDTYGDWFFETTRGPTNSPTMDDFKFIFYTVMTLSAIKWWEDSTAPTISNVWATPYTPSSDDDVTLSIYTSDWTDLFTVTLNAIDSPSGFSDVDYDCAKNSENTDFWSYTFTSSALPAGYYVFLATADDGAQVGTELIVFRVTSTAITDPINIEASGMDVQDDWITFIVQTNWNNATYTVWDNSTGSGVEVGYSSSEGWYQIAKPTVIATHWYWLLVNGTHSGSDSAGQTFDPTDTNDSWEWLNFKLTVNPVTFSITDPMVLQNNVSIIFQGIFYTADLTLDYTISEDGVQISTGILTIPESGSYYALRWDKSSASSVANWTVNLASGSDNITIYGFNFIIEGSAYNTYTYSASNVDNSKVVIYEPDDPIVAQANRDEEMWQAVTQLLQLVTLPIAFFIGVVLDRKFSSRRKRKDRPNDRYKST